MKVGAGGAAGAADRADHRASVHRLANARTKCRHVGIAGHQAVAVIDLHAVAIALADAGKADDTLV